MSNTEERLTEAIRQHMISDHGIYQYWIGIAERLCKLAHHKQWQASEHWSPYQSVVFKLEDMIKDWLEDKTGNEYSLNNTLVSVARAFVDYKRLAHVFTDDAVNAILYVNPIDGCLDNVDYLGVWDFQEWGALQNEPN